MDKLTYKRATRKDISKLVELDKKCFNRDFDNSFTEKEFETCLTQSGDTGFIYLNKTIIGFYSWVDIDNEESEIVGIAILPEYQKHGYGTTGVKMMLDSLKDKKKIKIVTHPKNTIALKMYKNLGFVVSGFSKDHYGPNQPRVVLYKIK
ncbi:hypothetical protein A2X44_00575 [candidate division CPR3 bacterium GWF2_35_18]|uniref:N-acetyltransferase domain-containing protein n=1 Tax=candidate division CPR3 bacterium GW2011_GWF2_35_18 TaxID=1618350 RepID=A0A0G0BL98_UNCC3|nr:MAG: hypothetical protein UR67_C0001G0097 [candidate division CPR3 bacterium GW2011_GWF2_35_18]OGB63408.1 MAG: hypothetical protein A2X44_00575 [candidate division CPR3 bacterium GWF2_35_18]OGB64847.1 MAG: hypothetical protein A2250_05455 [candidate division CPR3 bacterium RIFOXYA2_FULL_35_13]OGB76116.1 MAG: hypothetical protein A2476_05575 [candidate division CPR3 bacterium RIFOXYC2_FULL_35_7]OGB78967.1 MAG: hypothetical protein A2296_04560 [candidate division CPR3 bacterium RIFOXYB2_FULL_3